MWVRLHNDFHQTTVRVFRDHTGVLSHSQVDRAKAKLCGSARCQCSGTLGIRGPGNPIVQDYTHGRMRIVEEAQSYEERYGSTTL